MWVPFEEPLHRSAPPGVTNAASGDSPPPVDKVWRCALCGYQRLGTEAPSHCAGCGADGSQLVGRTAIEWRFLLRQSQREEQPPPTG